MRRYATSVRHIPGTMNKTEAAYAQELELRKLAGEIVSYAFEAVTLKLANDTRYTPDFLVVESDFTMSFVEVKGFWRDDAKIKIKVAADKFPQFRFRSVSKRAKKDGGGWDVTEF